MKGFVGPIGDDLPTIVAILLAIGLFFSSLIYTLDIYNQKMVDMYSMKGSIEIGRAVLESGLVSDLNPPAAKYIAKSYALNYSAYYDDQARDSAGRKKCPDNSVRLSYLVAVNEVGGPYLRRLTICTW
jgi:hypothetical protein